MNNAIVIILAASAAGFMVTLAKAGASPDFRAAIRTTLVLVLAWSLAWSHFGWKSWSGLTWQIQWMMLLSPMILVVAWFFHFRTGHKPTASPVPRMDQINVGFAIVFAALLLSERNMTQSPVIAVMLVGGALIIAFGW